MTTSTLTHQRLHLGNFRFPIFEHTYVATSISCAHVSPDLLETSINNVVNQARHSSIFTQNTNIAVKATNAQARKAEYDRARAAPITRIHCRPSRPDYDRMVRKLSGYAITVQPPAYNWSTDSATGNVFARCRLLLGRRPT